jgi:predicted DNA-binding protein YlxM (UPF0122 family)
MDIMGSKKEGGPYTKQQQAERRKKVNELYFEKHLSALKIAEILGINRNTINEDIKLAYLQASESFPDDSILIFLHSIKKMESQRFEIQKQLDSESDFSKKIILQKLLFQINNSLTKFYQKMTFHNYDVVHRFRKPIDPFYPIYNK